VPFLADWDDVALNGRAVYMVCDNEVMTKPQVKKALERHTEHFQRKGAHVVVVYLPMEGGKNVGVDAYLRMHTPEDLNGLIEAPRPKPQLAKPIIALLWEPHRDVRTCPLVRTIPNVWGGRHGKSSLIALQ